MAFGETRTPLARKHLPLLSVICAYTPPSPQTPEVSIPHMNNLLKMSRRARGDKTLDAKTCHSKHL